MPHLALKKCQTNIKLARKFANMPSKSQSQEHLMAAAAHNSKFAKKVGVPTKVAKEFNKADKGVKLKSLPKRVSGRGR